MEAMSFLTILIILALAAVVLVLFAGVGSMVMGGEFNRRYANVLMRYRVLLQFIAVMLIMLAFWMGAA